MVAINRESPLQDDLALLFERHTIDMHADTPPESIYMLDAAELAAPGISFLVARDDGRPVAMGAIKRITEDQAEIKSMHVLTEERGRGLSRLMLQSLIDAAATEGFKNLSLETGIQPTFVAARGLYASAGFETCGPFGDYRNDPNSVFMTIALQKHA